MGANILEFNSVVLSVGGDVLSVVTSAILRASVVWEIEGVLSP